MSLPIDFEKKVKMPDNEGYPYSIRAEDLMKNFAHCDLLPSDSGDTIRIELEDVPGETARHRQRKMRVVGTAGSNHPWKVSNQDGGLRVQGGDVYSGGVVISVPSKDISLSVGYVYAKITRNSARTMTAASIESGDAIPESTATYQYIPIALVAAGAILQLTSREMVIEELMISSNGALKLVTLDASALNTYDPPT
jgi:hypothetical protein